MGAEKPKVKKIGGSFDTLSFSLREDNARVSPTYFEWAEIKDNVKTTGKSFVFDNQLTYWASAYYDVCDYVAILAEPRGLHPENYEFIEQNHDKFHKVLTYDRELLDAIPNGLFYPLGGSSIAFEDWGIYPKTKDVCMIVSEKNTMPGHKLRHEIVNTFNDGEIDFYGAGVGKPFERKFDVLKDYKYCVVVESEPYPDYFSEKLIDAMSVGCYPIVWRPGKFDRKTDYQFFQIWFNNLGILSVSLSAQRRFSAVDLEHNLYNAKQYRIAEDWIYLYYPELFT